MKTAPLLLSRSRLAPVRERGIILVMTLIVLLVLMISAIALVRSVTASNLVAGSMSFRRDLSNQADTGIAAAKNTFAATMLTQAMRNQIQSAANYSPCILPTDAYGIPIVLEDSDANFAGSTTDLNAGVGCNANPVGLVANDVIDPATNDHIRYVIDRLCTVASPATPAQCAFTSSGVEQGHDIRNKAPTGQPLYVYRVTVRVTSNNVISYLQSTFSG